jgi:hypothetical protein
MIDNYEALKRRFRIAESHHDQLKTHGLTDRTGKPSVSFSTTV